MSTLQSPHGFFKPYPPPDNETQPCSVTCEPGVPRPGGSPGSPFSPARERETIDAAQAAIAWLRPMTGWEASCHFSALSAYVMRREWLSLNCELANVLNFARRHGETAGAMEVIRAISAIGSGRRHVERWVCTGCGAHLAQRDTVRRHLCVSCAEDARLEMR